VRSSKNGGYVERLRKKQKAPWIILDGALVIFLSCQTNSETVAESIQYWFLPNPSIITPSEPV
jgi:hypothetical protein